MTALTAFLPFVLPHVAVPDPMALEAIRYAAMEFCRMTDIVQRVSTASVVAGTQEYTVTAVSEMQVARILGVGWEGNWLSPVAPEQFTTDVGLRGADIGTATAVVGSPQYYLLKTPSATQFSLYPIPDTALTNGLTVKASFMPTQTATTVEDLLFNEYGKQIASGAVAHLMSLPQYASAVQPAHAAAFMMGVRHAKERKIFGNQAHNTRVRPRFFA
jgi:hypothetical protein